jgi:nicotinamide riboside kinase
LLIFTLNRWKFFYATQKVEIIRPESIFPAMLQKIVVIGPESTGKSTLCEMLAQHYRTEWCAEFAREWLLTNGTAYTYDDLLTIAKGQVALEEEYMAKKVDSWQLTVDGEKANYHQPTNALSQPSTINHQLLFLDTDMYVMKVWCEYVFNDCHHWILNRIAERKYDLYLLCKPDLPWVKDELREYPDEKPRQELYHIYRDLLVQQHVPWVEISGSYGERLARAVEAVDGMMANAATPIL